MKKQTGFSAFALALTFASPAFAHTGHGEVAGFMAGLAHPVFGLDHLLAMVTVGLWAGLVGGRSLFVWPASFVGAMLVGGALAMNGVMLPGVELVIAASVVALGLAVALRLKPQIVLGAALIALFGLAHGHAHGLEAPGTGSGFAYAVGFVLATAALHGVGLALATATQTRYAPTITRLLGGLAASAGVALAVIS
jgi:urease accessory protein